MAWLEDAWSRLLQRIAGNRMPHALMRLLLLLEDHQEEEHTLELEIDTKI